MSSRGTKLKTTRKSVQRRLVFDEEGHDSALPGQNEADDQRETRNHEAQSPQRRTKRGQTASTFESPEGKKTKVAPFVTPEQAASEKLSRYVPKYIHKNLDYARKGKAKLPESKLKIFNWIGERYVIPKDFEQKRSYGPLSGITYEERVTQAYCLRKLERSESAPDAETNICTACTEVGHRRDDCPTLI